MSSITGLFSFFLDKVINYLKLMNKDFKVFPKGIMVKDKVNGKEVEITIIPTEKWIRIQAKLDKLDAIPEEKRMEFLKELLKANNDYPEISFALDEEGFIVSVEDEYVFAFYFDVFEEEYSAVLASIDIYHKIKDKVLGIPAKQAARKKKEQQQ